MAIVISISNQKGGVGKSVTTASLGIGLVRQGKKVLTIDVDPQASLTISLGFPKPDEIPVTLATIMSGIIEENPLPLTEGIIHHAEGVDLMPASIELSGVEISLVNAMSRETILRQYIETVKPPASTPSGEIVMVAEAPIDALSLATLQKRKDAGWESRYYLSLGGVSPLALLHLLQNCPQINHIVLGLDNDKVGLEAIEQIKTAVYENEILRDRMLCITISPPPVGKDYNDTLLAVIKEQKEQEQRSRPNRAALSI